MATADPRLRSLGSSVTVSTDPAASGLAVLTVVLPESPAFEWTYSVVWVGGQPQFLRLAFGPSDPSRAVILPAHSVPIPWLRLVGIWRGFFNLHVDGTPRDEPGNLWDVLKSEEKLSLGKRPRLTKKTNIEDYSREMIEWTEPVAAAVLAAHTAVAPIQKYVAKRFGFSVDRAKQVIETAREYHPYLPKQSRPGDPKPSASTRKPRRSVPLSVTSNRPTGRQNP